MTMQPVPRVPSPCFSLIPGGGGRGEQELSLENVCSAVGFIPHCISFIHQPYVVGEAN